MARTPRTYTFEDRYKLDVSDVPDAAAYMTRALQNMRALAAELKSGIQVWQSGTDGICYGGHDQEDYLAYQLRLYGDRPTNRAVFITLHHTDAAAQEIEAHRAAKLLTEHGVEQNKDYEIIKTNDTLATTSTFAFDRLSKAQILARIAHAGTYKLSPPEPATPTEPRHRLPRNRKDFH